MFQFYPKSKFIKYVQVYRKFSPTYIHQIVWYRDPIGQEICLFPGARYFQLLQIMDLELETLKCIYMDSLFVIFLKLIVYLQFLLNINIKFTLIQSTNHISSLGLKAGVEPNIPYRCNIFFYNPGQSLRMLFSLITTRKIQLYNLEKDVTMWYYH